MRNLYECLEKSENNWTRFPCNHASVGFWHEFDFLLQIWKGNRITIKSWFNFSLHWLNKSLTYQMEFFDQEWIIFVYNSSGDTQTEEGIRFWKSFPCISHESGWHCQQSNDTWLWFDSLLQWTRNFLLQKISQTHKTKTKHTQKKPNQKHSPQFLIMTV